MNWKEFATKFLGASGAYQVNDSTIVIPLVNSSGDVFEAVLQEGEDNIQRLFDAAKACDKSEEV